MKNTIILLAILISISLVFSSQLTIEDTRIAAENHPIIRNRADISLKGEAHRDEHFIIYEYSPKGFAAISRDTNIRPVIAWSFSSKLTGSELGIIDILRQDLYNRHKVLNRTPQSTIHENRELWHDYLSQNPLTFTDITEYGPWTTTTWNQGEPYNALCPLDPVTGERCPTGCVITCVAQILNYWEYPYSIPLTADDNYTSESTDPPIEIDATTANMDTINWNGDGLDEPDSLEIAEIMWAIGVKLQAGYQDGGTVAHCEADHMRAGFDFPMAENFSITRPGYRTVARENMIEGKVGYMSMSGPDAGHAMVLDGWEESGAYHINMGWGGHEDAWYYVFDEMPLEFTGITGMILNMIANFHWDIENSCTRAKEIIPRTHKQKVINAIMPETDVDWFTFEATEDSSYQFWSTGPNDMYMEIYNACDGEPIFTLEEGGSENNFMGIWSTEPGESGTYYIKVGAYEASMDVNYKFWYQRILGPDRPFINLMTPSGGETIIGGGTQSIFFTKGGTPPVQRVRIEYSIAGTEGPWELIADSLISSFYTWHVPEFDEELYDYRHCYIKITDIASPIFGINENPFRIRDPEGVEESPLTPDEVQVSVYPNPFNSRLNIAYNALKDATITITDITGKKLAEWQKITGSGTLPYEHEASSGILILRVQSENTNISQKISYIK